MMQRSASEGSIKMPNSLLEGEKPDGGHAGRTSLQEAAESGHLVVGERLQ